MPLAVDSLTKDSTIQSIREAISQSIETCMKEGKTQKECAGMSYSIARENTGQSLGEGKS